MNEWAKAQIIVHARGFVLKKLDPWVGGALHDNPAEHINMPIALLRGAEGPVLSFFLVVVAAPQTFFKLLKSIY